VDAAVCADPAGDAGGSVDLVDLLLLGLHDLELGVALSMKRLTGGWSPIDW